MPTLPRLLAALLAACVASASLPAMAANPRHEGAAKHRTERTPRHAQSRCPACNHRSSAAKSAFRRAHPCPATGKRSGPCPGYVIDHIKALKRGGADAPGNMQWQTAKEAKAKDRVE